MDLTNYASILNKLTGESHVRRIIYPIEFMLLQWLPKSKKKKNCDYEIKDGVLTQYILFNLRFYWEKWAISSVENVGGYSVIPRLECSSFQTRVRQKHKLKKSLAASAPPQSAVTFWLWRRHSNICRNVSCFHPINTIWK